MADIVIIGGGASGMLAALTASENPQNRICLIERQPRLGRKLLQTGNGRCNLSNTAARREHYHGADASFVCPALEAFSPDDTRRYFSALGLITVEEYGGRVYPLSNQANSVLDVLRFSLEARPNVELLTNTAVTAIHKGRPGFSVAMEGRDIRCEKVIVACGGCASGKLGGCMDGYTLLSSLGHSRTLLYPALTQIRTDAAFPHALKGVRADAAISIEKAGRVLAANEGEILFTDTGVSGTAVFEISRAAATGGSGLTLMLDFFRKSAEGELLPHLTGVCRRLPDLPGNQILTGTVNNRLGQMLCKYCGIRQDTPAGRLSGRQLQVLAAMCRAFPLKITGVSGFDSAQVTAGGIRTSEFDPRTLQSRLVPGLYACGEVLDIDGDCGGFNLQWAWSSGRLAGQLSG